MRNPDKRSFISVAVSAHESLISCLPFLQCLVTDAANQLILDCFDIVRDTLDSAGDQSHMVSQNRIKFSHQLHSF